MSTYADTSFLAPLYLSESHSPAAALAMKKAELPILMTSFGELELTNAIQRRAFQKDLTRSQVKQALALMHRDIAAGVYFLRPLPATAFERALRLSKKYTPALGTRSLDILHVASALDLHAKTFYTFDQKQAVLAAKAGLHVAP